MPAAKTSASLIVVGDIHQHWREGDARFLEGGDQDLTMFVGDLGDEDVEMARAVAELRAEKVVILGNHDAWQSFSWKRPSSRLLEIMDLLQPVHLAYDVCEVPGGGISIVGARPFSWGGRDLRSPEIYDTLYGVRNVEDSVLRILDAARRAKHRDIVILAHNGPKGLGKHPRDIYGKDFGRSPRGDWGDRDLQLAIERIVGSGLRVPVVVAGHMHDLLMFPRGEERRRFVRRDGILYVNPAVVPRIRRRGGGDLLSHFLRMSFAGGELQELEEVWVDDVGDVRRAETPRVEEA